MTMVKLNFKIARVQIADDIFLSGDGILLGNIEITLGENERASSCSFSVYDPDLKIGSKYQKISLEQGGILVDDNLLKKEEVKGASTGGSADSSTGSLQSSGGGNEQENIKLIVSECIKQGVTDVKQIAYILATTQHESGFMPVSEIGGASARYAPYYGRGFVQLTWKENYAKYSQKLGKDFVANPDLIKEPRIAAFILVDGMKNGVFTGAKLGDFINGEKANYYDARTIVNSHDRADLIAGYAKEWEKKVPGLMGGNTNLAPSTNQSTSNSTVNVSKPVQETSNKGTEIIIELGFSSNKKLIAFHFIHVGTQTSFGNGNITTFEGKMIRWLLTRVPETTSYENVSLRDISEKIAKSYGMDLKMEGIGVKYEYLDQTGLTPLQLLRRETSKIGYKISEDKATLVIEPEGKPKFSNFIIDENTLISIVFTDKARGSKPTPYQAITNPYSSSQDTKFVLDRKTGEIQQFKNETFIGTSQEKVDKPATVTGNAATSNTGILKPTKDYGSNPIGFSSQIVGDQYKSEPIKIDKSETTNDSGDKVLREQTTEVSKKRGAIIKSVTIKQTTIVGATEVKSETITTTQKEVVFEGDKPIKQKVTVTRKYNGNGDATVIESTKIDQDLQNTLKLLYESPPSENNYGLPKQIPGILDLADGRAEAQVIANEAERIRGYESTAKLFTTEEVLAIVPGEIIGLSSRLFPEPFDREWRVYSVTHSWESDTSTLVFYTPQGLQEGVVTADEEGNTQSATQTPEGALAVPCWLQTDNKINPDGQCNTSANAMVAKFLGAKIDSDDEYFAKYVNKYGDTTDHSAQSQALSELGVKSTWNTNLDFADLDKSLARDKPIVIGIKHRGTEQNPTGGHVIVIIGKTKDGNYIVNDPYGSLNDGYKTDPKNGCGAVYSRKALTARWTLDGKGSGWGRIFN